MVRKHAWEAQDKIQDEALIDASWLHTYTMPLCVLNLDQTSINILINGQEQDDERERIGSYWLGNDNYITVKGGVGCTIRIRTTSGIYFL